MRGLKKDNWSSDEGRRQYIYGDMNDYEEVVIMIRKRTKVKLNDALQEIIDYKYDNDDKWQIMGIKEVKKSGFNIDSYIKHLNESSRWDRSYSQDEVDSSIQLADIMLRFVLKSNKIKFKKILKRKGQSIDTRYCNWEVIR